MAIDMQKKMQELEGQWAENFTLKQPLKIRIGINTGYCTVGNFGSENRLDYTVIGGQVNLASRLESIARPGEISISFDTYSQVNDEINCVEVETVHVKGIRDEIRVFEVILDNEKKRERLEFKTENLECKLDIDNLDMEEMKKFTEFVEKSRRRS